MDLTLQVVTSHLTAPVMEQRLPVILISKLEVVTSVLVQQHQLAYLMSPEQLLVKQWQYSMKQVTKQSLLQVQVETTVLSLKTAETLVLAPQHQGQKYKQLVLVQEIQ